MQLVDLIELIPGMVVDMRYGTANNIAGRALYSSDQTVPRLDEAAAQALHAAATEFEQQDLAIVIWDAYRPPEVQQQLRAVNSDEQYVLEESNHCKGLAIDLTLARTDGTCLDMGTDHDDFSPKAHDGASGLTDEQIANRKLLKEVMQKHGFRVWPFEWWHFDFRQS